MRTISCSAARRSLYGILRASVAAAAIALALAATAVPVIAQGDSSLAGRLPSGTIAYVEWKGAAFLSPAATRNHFLQLLADPDATAAEQNLAAEWLAMSRATGSHAGSFFALLRNPAIAGVIETGVPDPAKPAMFLIYDASGQEALLSTLRAAQKKNGKAARESSYTFAKAEVDVRTAGTSSTYTTQIGRYFLCADQQSAIEELITQFQGPRTAKPLREVPEYQQVQKFLGPAGAIQVFLRVNALAEIAANQKSAPQARQVVESMHLARIHSAGWSISFEGEATHARGVVFGNTAPGGPFDIIGASSASFATQPIAAGSASFAVSRFDWAAAYRLIRGVAAGAMSPQQASNVAAVEGMAQGFLGMPIDDALALFNGEMARATTYTEDGTTQSVIAIAIQRPNDVLRILRAVVGPMTLSEDSSGETTFLDIAYPYKDPATGMARRKLYYIAVTPHLILAAPRKGMLTHAAEAVASAAPPGEATAAPQASAFGPAYPALRAQLPRNLSGLMVSDWSRIPLDQLVANLVNQAQAAMKQSSNPHPPDLSFLRGIKLDAIPRHLHMSVGGWWKDSNGVYFDSYLE